MYTISFSNNRLSPDDADELARYVAIIPAMALLTPEQEATADRDTLVERNMRLSALVAIKYSGRGVPISDLIQEGNIGLIRAAETFDPKRGRFSTYAVKSIREYILRAVHNHGNTIRKPVWAQDGSNRPGARASTRALVKSREVVSGDKTTTVIYSSAPLADGHNGMDRTLFEVIPDPSDTEAEAIGNVDRSTAAPAIKRALAGLNARDRDLIERRHFRGQGVPEIAAALGYTNGSTRQLLTDARKRLRALLQSEGIHGVV